MNNMEFEEEMQDKEYFEEKINRLGETINRELFSLKMRNEYFEKKIESLEKKVTLLEDKAIIFGGWVDPENESSFHDRAEKIREYLKKEREIKNDK